MYAFLADHRHELFPAELFIDLARQGGGHPSVPADVVATVMVLQALEGLSDREAISAQLSSHDRLSGTNKGHRGDLRPVGRLISRGAASGWLVPCCAEAGLSETLLVCYMEFSPVGHVVELLRYALGYHAADPSRRIGVLLPANAPRELADLCPFVDAVYPVSPRLHDLPASLAQVPRDWDWIVDNPRRYDPTHVAAWDGLDRFFAATERALRARRGRTVIGVEPPSYRPHQQLRLPIPDADREAAHNLLADAEVRIAVMPTGSGPRAHYPSAGSWELILRGLTQRFPAVRFCLLGKLRADERTRSTFGVDEFARLLAAFPDVVDGFDRPIVEQLALVEACDLFLSPHTGFGMAALAVATPWLTISGGSWGEYFFNGVPFYSLLPDPERFGAYTPYHPPPLLAGDEDGEGPRTPSMSRGRIAHDLDELLEAAALLVEDRLAYDDALRQHFARLLRIVDRSEVWSFENLHRDYV